ncbi:MAG: tyrosine-type recombinase/integrase [Candidatus Thiodiazotropha endolucinida]|nr:tyrosine-type recombinase/integrase [Candidatus Thiodiazotropha taylori]MCW4261073.1 tyrosine-type recombinase/integrase [Candidatus Thiodiazotropha endolucinida]MCG8102337.1 tyrosine-type recombinase/integrase [Candidatus Thiodiazotropha taylori]MCG8120901.1 tyrosine-type recombinase/integrase [Candidatus Thiodiazotropha taylori]MCW4287660.1 tyrosine-type recombinase/integrase [Candidatus Thiodiazotropha endolucinida]
MRLTALQVKNAACPDGQKQSKLSDGNNLYLLIKNTGHKYWRLRYKYAGKYQELALGTYPKIPLSDARKLADDARVQLIQGINPAEARREKKRLKKSPDRTFKVIALRWWEQQSPSWTEGNAKKIKRWIDNDMKIIANLPVDQIDEAHIRDVMLGVESSSHPTAASPILSNISRIFGYALSHRLTRKNPAQGFPLSDILKPLPKTRHLSAITDPKRLGRLIFDIDNLQSGGYCTIQALQLIPHMFLRPGEIRALKWEYIDFEDKLIRIPSDDMKRDREHLVPMSKQVIEKLQSIKKVTGYSPYVFPSQRDSNNPMSKNVMTNRLRVLGYASDEMSAHGFRTSASTLLHEKGYKHDAIEAQLAHLTGTATSRAYNRSIYLSERKKIMQAWSDYLDVLRNEADLK